MGRDPIILTARGGDAGQYAEALLRVIFESMIPHLTLFLCLYILPTDKDNMTPNRNFF